MHRLLALVALSLLAGCAWYPISRIPADTASALVVRCREVKGWFGRDSHWVMIVWVWSQTDTLPENPGNIEIDSDCRWSVERQSEPEPQITIRPKEAQFKPDAEPPPK